MRKSLLLTSLFAIALLALGAGFASACHHDGASSASAASDASRCSTKGISTASTASNCSSKGVSTASADAAACATKGVSTASADACAAACATKGVSTASADACAAACAGKGVSCTTTASAGGDYFVASYMDLRAAMDKHCNVSMTTAANSWKQGLHEILASGKAEEHRSALKSLAMQLENWPTEADAQQARFGQISEWTASYCEMFPEKTAGATVKTCPTSGHRWVETASASAEGDTQG